MTARCAVSVMLVALLATGCSDRNDVPDVAPPTTARAPSTVAPVPAPVPAPDPARRPEGFDTMTATVTTPAADECELCLWVADTDSLRSRGLMFVDDLGGADGMAFVYDAPRSTAFTMRNTVLPLTIVFYDPDGAFLDAFDMEPCVTEPCVRYPTPDGFGVAIEIEQGRADDLGLVEGSVLRLGPRLGVDGCDTP